MHTVDVKYIVTDITYDAPFGYQNYTIHHLKCLKCKVYRIEYSAVNFHSENHTNTKLQQQ